MPHAAPPVLFFAHRLMSLQPDIGYSGPLLVFSLANLAPAHHRVTACLQWDGSSNQQGESGSATPFTSAFRNRGALSENHKRFKHYTSLKEF